MRGIVRRCFAFASVTATATHLAYNGSCGARARADRIDHSPTTLTATISMRRNDRYQFVQRQLFQAIVPSFQPSTQLCLAFSALCVL